MIQTRLLFAMLLLISALCGCNRDKEDEVLTPVMQQEKAGRIEAGRLAQYIVSEVIYHADGGRSHERYTIQVQSVSARNGTGVLRLTTPYTQNGYCTAYSSGLNSFYFVGTLPARFANRRTVVSLNGTVTGNTISFSWRDAAGRTWAHGSGTLTGYY